MNMDITKRLPFYNTTRTKLIASFLGFSFLIGGVPFLVGGRLLYNTFLQEAKTRIIQDLNAARQIYDDWSEHVAVALTVAAHGDDFRKALTSGDAAALHSIVRHVADAGRLDLVGVVGGDGRTLAVSVDDVGGTLAGLEPIAAAQMSMRSHRVVKGTMVLPRSYLARLDPDLVDRARIPVRNPDGSPKGDQRVEDAMTLSAAVPVMEGNRLVGVLFGLKILNKSPDIVDTVRDTLFRDETYQGKKAGTATIFYKDIRIATNVMDQNGARAIGTRVSPEVAEQVLGKGLRWRNPAFVVNDWYITCYEPIVDLLGNRVGMLYVGVLEKPYADVRNRALLLFAVLSGVGMIAAIGLGYFLEWKIMLPIYRLSHAAVEVSKGNLNPKLGFMAGGEIGILQKTFMDMLQAIREREWRQREETETKLLMAQRLASVGRLAAGVAHEVNNPLTGVLTFAHMLLRREDLGEDVREQLKVIVDATERVRRIVRGLLDFSRQTRLKTQPTDINAMVRQTLPLVANQALIKGIALEFREGANLPKVSVDAEQLKSVLLNLVINALDATDPGGSITVKSRLALSATKEGDSRRGVEIAVEDTGCGVPPEDLEKVFEPFFTTKEVGKGTGLGLAVAYGIVARHGGMMRVRSELGQGTEFTIWLPLGDDDNDWKDSRG
ncbi:Signal transduction histidine kinase [Desulfacinum hydrothermale DSM 13146]|uniref:histidine kinase n=1 Tax=Desulfacinum hydrothermale DSM 13146 TaxID=1121390 RepID=A0A1W1X4G1_9BACT|nr:cache domain-containing protein [Desulfacinum hydrothermale]SMC18849.1 Signal transduction histidine kinase [Desulfacinum hydrothermale DSM 13146]